MLPTGRKDGAEVSDGALDLLVDRGIGAEVVVHARHEVGDGGDARAAASVEFNVFDGPFSVLGVPLVGSGGPVGRKSTVEDETGGSHARAEVLNRLDASHVGRVHVEAFQTQVARLGQHPVVAHYARLRRRIGL